MPSSSLKVLALFLIFAGECLSVYAATSGAFTHGIAERPFMTVFLRMFPLFTLAGALLISGFILGYRAFGNIWIVNVVSITTLLIAEPLLTWMIFHELPTRGAGIGFGFGVVGLGFALFL
ncbi:MAG: hypothetical protein Q7R81_07915 [Candidatus Peregrinibacteria bacterium]|nr:hypothetical protein [Candidatus Peregrinibacteria bacterium]